MEKYTDKPKWFVAIVKPRAEKQLSKRLSEAGIENFLPLQRQLHIWHDRKKWVEMPLFPSYIFIRTEERLRARVFGIDGIVRFVSFGGKAAVLSENEIARIHRLCEWLGEVAIEEGTLRKGDEVEILAGHFKGMQGQVLDDGGKNLLRIAIEGLGCVATVRLNEEEVKKIQ